MNRPHEEQAPSTGIVKTGFGEETIEQRGETSASALAAQATAEVNARYIMALQHPRDLDLVRVQLLRACERPGFAERAFYSLPRAGAGPGKITGTPGRIEGLSVRWAEEAVRAMRHILTQSHAIADNDRERTVRVTVTDCESNSAYQEDITIDKTIERTKPRDGQRVLGKRETSTGAVVFIVQASPEEIRQKQASEVARRRREGMKHLTPADIVEECERKIIATIKARDATDPDAARKAVADAFAALGVMPDALKAYLGHDLGTCSPAELTDLRGLYAAIKEGDVTWAEVLADRAKPAEPEAPPADGKPAARTVTERIRERQAAKGEPKAPESKPAEREPGEEG